MKHIQRITSLLMAATVALFLAACASIMGPKTMTFTDADLARMLESHGPFQKRLLEVLDVRVQRPTVHLMPEVNRLSSDLDLVTTERVSGKTYTGHIGVDYGLRYDDAVQGIRLTQVHVNKLQIDGLPNPEKTGLSRLGALIAEQMLNDVVIYRFRPNDLKNAEGHGYKPSAVTVTSRGVEVTLSPAGR